MGKARFSPRELKFLEFYFGGALMKDAARAAGYQGTSDQALCNTGRAILAKFSKTPWAWTGKRKIAQLLLDRGDNMPEFQRLKALKSFLGA
jgi:hypothetical protein